MSGTYSGEGNLRAFSAVVARRIRTAPRLSLNTALVFGTKKNLFDKKRNVQASHSYLPETFSVGVGTFPEGGLPWFQRACPSTTLDKNYVFNCRPEFIGLRAHLSSLLSPKKQPRRALCGQARTSRRCGRLPRITIGTDCSRFRPCRPNGNGAKRDERLGQEEGRP